MAVGGGRLGARGRQRERVVVGDQLQADLAVQSQSMLQRERGADVSTVVLRSTSHVQFLLPALAELIYGSTSTL